MPNEQTPLIQTIVVVTPYQRYPHQRFRRICTVLLAGGCLLATLAFLGPLVFADSGRTGIGGFWPWQTYYPSPSWSESSGVTYKDLQDILLSTPDEAQVKEWSRYYTSGPHLAGKNLSQALWTRDRWQAFGVEDTSIIAYDVYVNYPIGHRLALLDEDHKVKHEAALEEDVLEEDRTSGLQNRVPTFHGYSASGNVTASYVYVNYGTYQDYEDLLHAKVNLTGKIALIKYGGIFRGLKVKRAQQLGMVGAVIYTDPGDDGDITDVNGNKTYPNGPAREPSSVQRGSTQFLSIAPGDPTTPGYPSKPGVPRQPVDKTIPSIPSIPISYLDAIPFLKALNGHGPNATSFNKYWQGGGLGHKGVRYNIGPSPPELTLNLVNQQEYVTTPMWNVIGIINGTLSDEVIVMGNHRDAWIAGGAADPNSGSAAFNEVIRGLGKALKAGWKPLRTIVLASWDGEEYGLIGSTEWVEEYLPWLSKSAVAYINVDVGTSGPYFTAAAAPLLDHALIAAAHMVQSPNQTIKGQTVGDVWDGKIRTMGSGSDFTAFQDYAGIPCIDMGFGPGPNVPVYHYHSNYDSFDWMDRFGDPGWHYHATMAKVWGMLAAKLVETPVVQFNATDYANALRRYLDAVEDKAIQSTLVGEKIAFKKLRTAISDLRNVSIELDAKSDSIMEQLDRSRGAPWYKWWQKVKLYYQIRHVNEKYKYLERQFLHPEGLDGRNWFKHTVFAPGLWTGYAGATFPGLVESLDKGDKKSVYRWLDIITEQVESAITLLK